MEERTKFPPVFWVANSIESWSALPTTASTSASGSTWQHLGYSRDQLGIVQSIFLLLSYGIPVISGTFADRYGFKKVLIVSYLAYLPSILLLILTKSFSGIALTMLAIGLAAGIFKPLIAGTVRAVTDKTNKTLGFGIFYAMVNVGGSFGPDRGRASCGPSPGTTPSWPPPSASGHAAYHDLLLQGTGAGDRGRARSGRSSKTSGSPSPTSSSRSSWSCWVCSSGSRSGPSSTCAPSMSTAISTRPSSI